MKISKTPRNDVEILSRVKQVVYCNLQDTINSFLASGDWILIGIYKGRSTNPMCVLGRIREI